MTELPISQLMGLCGGLCGFVLGAAARSARFCTFGAIEDYVLTGETRRLKAWILAIIVCMLCVQALSFLDVARIDESAYLSPDFSWLGAICGGFIFGVGMAFVGTCSFGALVRLAGGDLKALVTAIILGLSAYMTARGIASPIRAQLFDVFNADLSVAGGQGAHQLLAAASGLDAALLAILIVIVLSFMALRWCAQDGFFANSKRDVFAGLVLGLTIGAGYFATGYLGDGDFETHPVRSLTFSLPPGETLIYLATFTGASINFAIGSVFGVLLGAGAVTAIKREFRIEAYDDAREMYRHLGGALMMGFGGVTAVGCTIGQGLSGMATLSLSAPLTLMGIMVGANFGLHYLLTGSLSEAIAVMAHKLRRS